MSRWVGVAAGVNLALAVGLGAFGAHGLRGVIDEGAMEWFKTGHSYHMWHGLGLLALVVLPLTARMRGVLAGLFLGGTLLFSGSLYVMAVTGMRWLGMITPLGGVSWIAAWAVLAVALGKGSGELS